MTTDQHAGWCELDGMTEGFQIGGDLQVHDGFMRRYLFGPVSDRYLLVEEYVYPIIVDVHPEDARHGTYSYEEQMEFTLCTDPDDPYDTEIDEHTDYGPGGYLCRGELDQAIEDARQACSRSGVWIFEGFYDPTEELRAGRLRHTVS